MTLKLHEVQAALSLRVVVHTNFSCHSSVKSHECPNTQFRFPLPCVLTVSSCLKYKQLLTPQSTEHCVSNRFTSSPVVTFQSVGDLVSVHLLAHACTAKSVLCCLSDPVIGWNLIET